MDLTDYGEDRRVHTARKDRRQWDGTIKRGPTHWIYTANQMWCGVKIVGFAAWSHESGVEDVDCVKCLRAFAQNKPRAWRR